MNSKEINPLFENEFFDTIQSDANVDASCTSGRQSRAYHFHGTWEDIPQHDILKKMTLEDFLLQINVLFQEEEEMNLKILITLDTVQKWEI